MQQAGKLQPEGEESFFIAQTDGYYFAEHPNLSAGSVDVKTERDVTTFSKTTHNYFLDLGYLRAGERVTLHASDDKSVEGTVYKISEEAVKRSVDTLRANTMEMQEYSDTKILGRIEAPSEKALILMIPAEPGWTIKVDGEVTETETFMNAFFAIPLTNGSHEILLTYQSPGIKAGLAISLVCLGMLILLLGIEGRRRRQDRNLISISRGIGLEK